MAKRRRKKHRRTTSVMPAQATRPAPPPMRMTAPAIVPAISAAHDAMRQRTADLAAARAELQGDRARILGASELRTAAAAETPRAALTLWSFPAVHARLKEAAQTLDRMPARTRPQQFGNGWPQWTYDRGDLNAQQQSGELEIAMGMRNRVRSAATPDQIARMLQTLDWASRYLGDKPEVARAVNLAAQWSARGQSFERMAVREGLRADWLSRQWIHGLRLIAGGLNRDRVAVT